MVQFVAAEELKRKYAVYGNFYSVQVTRKLIVQCRNVLELVAHDVSTGEPDAISQHAPDAVAIMMNPGSSQPRIEVQNQIEAEAIHELGGRLVPTKPDTTQYQLMRLMHYCGWQHVRVLNLSDIRCSKSIEFFQQFQRLEDEASFDAHSIFSERRTQELDLMLTSDKKTPLICGWGLSPELDPLIDRCSSKIKKHKTILGLLKEGTTNRYLHPLPTLQKQKIAWVDRMVVQCQEINA